MERGLVNKATILSSLILLLIILGERVPFAAANIVNKYTFNLPDGWTIGGQITFLLFKAY